MFLHVYEQKKAKRYQLLESKTIMHLQKCSTNAVKLNS